MLGARNLGERKKLLNYDGRGVLVLFDFSRRRLADDELNGYRGYVPLGRGFRRSPFNLAYYYVSLWRPISPALEIRNIRR